MIAWCTIFGQLVFFALMLAYYMALDCDLKFAVVDADWDDANYADFFADNIQFCSSEIYVTSPIYDDDDDDYTYQAANGLGEHA